MRVPHRHLESVTRIIVVILAFGLTLPLLPSQEQKPQPKQEGTTIRVKVALVQTDVMVFDRNGRFVDNLKPDQFELRVDGKVQPISFCELVSAGSPHDEAIWARAEDKPAPSPRPPDPKSNPGRTLLLFLDDWHLTEDSVMRSRTALANLINTSMGPKDRVGIFAASGQLSSLQQLTSDKAALLASLQKFNFQSAGPQDLQWPPMTEAQALLIEQNDWDAITYFVQAMTGKPVVRDNRGWTLPFDRNPDFGRDIRMAEETTRRRATDLAQISAGIGERSLSSLRNLLHAAADLPGRKLVFLLSDGFVLQPQRSDVVSRVRQVTTAAARAGILIYTLDARGLVVGLPDARTKRAGDMTGALAHSGYNEVMAPQDALNALAVDTGGRFLKNANALDAALITTLAEISRYYLLGWIIDPDSVQPGKYSSIRVDVKGRSNLSVRVRQGALDLSQLLSKKQSGLEPPAPPLSEAQLYAQAKSVADLTRDELLNAYPAEMQDVRFEEDGGRLALLLEKAGEKVEAFFRNFPNTVSKEQVRMERLDRDGRVEASITRNYLYSFAPDKSGANWEENRTESNGKPVDFTIIPGFFLAPGRAGMTAFLHPRHRDNCRFRYLGRQASDSSIDVIAFAQKPESGDYLGSYQYQTMPAPIPLLYQGFVWVDSRSYQIVRMRTDLLAPRTDAGLRRQTSEIWFSEVRFQSVPEPFWLPREVVITNEDFSQRGRNRHRYSEYQVFTVTVQEKIAPPQVKK